MRGVDEVVAQSVGGPVRAGRRAGLVAERPGPSAAPAVPVLHCHSVSIVMLFVQYKCFG